MNLGLGSLIVDGATSTALNLSGGGHFDIDGNTSHTGGTTVTGMTLNVDGIIGDVEVFAGGVIQGSGTYGNITTNVGATVAPGNSPGTMIAGSFDLVVGATLDMELGGLAANPGTDYDQLIVNGDVTLAGDLDVSLFSPTTAGQSYVIINKTTAGAISGAFAGLAEGATFDVDGIPMQISYVGGDGNDVTLTPQGTIFTVVNTNDSGPGSLRQAIIDANADTFRDLIQFDIPGPGPSVITPASDLPSITAAVILDGTSEPNFNGTPIVEIFGNGTGRGIEFFGSDTAGSQLLGLSLHGFSSGGAVEIVDTSTIEVKGNYFGLRADGSTSPFSSSEGVRIQDSTDVIVGGPSVADRNVIANGVTSGITVTGSSSDNNIIEGNFIGTNRFGFAAVGNLDGVIVRAGAKNTQIGVAGGAPNVISGNTGRGISVADFATNGTVIVNNFIGTDRFGNAALTNGAHAIDASQTPGAIAIGDGTAGGRNIIVGSNTVSEAIRIQSSNLTLRGNYIGTDVTGTIGLGGQSGIRVTSAATFTQIGGSVAGMGNLIAGMSSYGIIDQGTSTGIRGNLIGTDASGLQTIGVGNAGIFVDGGQSTIIGSPGACNTIAGVNAVIAQSGHGILLDNAAGSTTPILIESNLIGIGRDGTTSLSITGNGVEVSTGTSAIIGNTSPDAANVIGNANIGINYTSSLDIVGNYVGVSADGTTPQPNNVGIRVGGGSVAGIEDNVVAFNTGDGIQLTGNANHRIRRTEIYGNGGLPIDRNDDGPGGPVTFTLNPIVGGGSGGISGTFSGAATGANVDVDIFSSDVPGEAQQYLGTYSFIPGATAGTFSDTTVLPGGKYITVYAYAGNTGSSEVSNSVFTGLSVTTTADSGPGSLRQAILDANVDANTDIITFNIAGTGPHVITLASALPDIIHPLTIDGYSDPEASPNTLSVGNNAVIEWEVNGGGTIATGLNILTNDVTVRGLSIGNFSGSAIYSSFDRIVVEGNFIGVRPNGATAIVNGRGVYLNSTHNSRIGTNSDGVGDLGERNVIAASSIENVLVDGGSFLTTVAGNYVGTNAAGTAAILTSVDRIRITNSAVKIVGNLVSGGGSTSQGINLFSGQDGPTESQLSWFALFSGLADKIGGSAGSGTVIAGDFASGVNGNGLNFPTAAATAITLPTPATLAPGNFAFDAWLRPNLVSAAVGDYFPVVSDLAGLNIGLVKTAFGADVLVRRGTSTTDVVRTTSSLIRTGVDSHLAINVDGTTVTVFIHGKLVASGSLASPLSTTSTSIRLGSNTTGQTFRGVIDEVGLHGRALFESEVGAIAILNGQGKAGSIVQGNVIGLNATGTGVLPNNHGIMVNQSYGDFIGGDSTDKRNVISGNTNLQINVFGSGGANTGYATVIGNFLGTNVAGTALLGSGQYGIRLDSTSNLVHDNVIAGATLDNVYVDNNSHGNVVSGNHIGVDVTGTVSLGGTRGVTVDGGSTNVVGGPNPEDRNIISGHTNEGIWMFTDPSPRPEMAYWWRGENNSGSSLGGSALQANGSVFYADGLIGNRAFQLASGPDFTGLVANALFDYGSAYTIEFWFNPDDAARSQTLAGIGIHEFSTASAVRVDLTPNGKLQLVAPTTLANSIAVSGSTSIKSGQWYHAAVTYDGADQIRLFINGTEEAALQHHLVDSSSDQTVFGYKINPGLNNDQNFQGFYDEIAFYEAKLSQANIAELYSTRGASKGANRIEGNYIGTDVTGTLVQPNGGTTLNSQPGILSQQPGAIIGGATERAGTGRGNLISGNNNNGIKLDGPNAVVVQGNMIGIASDGVTPLRNGLAGNSENAGIFVSSSSYHLIGGGERQGNVISGNTGDGIFFFGTNQNIRISGHFIGTDVTGTIDVGNGQSGVHYFSGDQLIVGTNGDGFDDEFEGNVISGNADRGVRVRAAGSNIVIAGNMIGLDVTGTVPLVQIRGISVQDNALNVTIGGVLPAQRNVISGNISEDLITFTGGANGLTVLNNYFGTDITGSFIPGSPSGGKIGLYDSTTNIRFGDKDIEGSGNLFAFGDGQQLQVIGALGFEFYRNRMGTDASGNVSLLAPPPDFPPMVRITTSTGVIIGAAGAGNQFVTGGTRRAAVTLTDVSNAVIQSNLFGTNADGSAALGGGTLSDIRITGGGGNLVGTDGDGINDAIEGNVLAGGNGTNAAFLIRQSTGNVIAGNHIGVSADGLTKLATGIIGIQIEDAADNRIGGPLPTDQNLIVGYSTATIQMTETVTAPTTSDNLIQNNMIGVGLGGVPVGGQSTFGVSIGSGVVETSVIGNTIGNVNQGVDVTSGSSQTTIQGNFFGINASGQEIANGNSVVVRDNAAGIDIGGVTPASGNRFGFHTGQAVILQGGNDIEILSNTFGVSLSGNSVLASTVFNQNAAIRIQDSDVDQVYIGVRADLNTVAPNVIGGHAVGIGVTTDKSTANLHIVGNSIGTDPSGLIDLGNRGEGIQLLTGSANIRANRIAFNDAAGVAVGAGTFTITGNRIYANTGIGIDVLSDGPTANADNDDVTNTPTFTALPGGQTTVSGSLTGPSDFVPPVIGPFEVTTVEFFASTSVGGASADARRFVGSIDVAIGAGTTTFSGLMLNGSTIAGEFLTATATFRGHTSELAAAIQVTSGAPPAIASSDIILTVLQEDDGFGEPTDSITEGQTVRVDGLFQNTDGTDTHTITIDWEDGSPLSTITLLAGARGFTGQHTYTDNRPAGAPVTISILVADDDGQSGLATRQLSIDNSPAEFGSDPVVTFTRGGQPVTSPREGDLVRITGTIIDAGTADSHSVQAFWNTGLVGNPSPTTSPTTIQYVSAGVHAYDITYRYNDNGQFDVALELRDDDGSLATRSLAVSLNNAEPTATIIGPTLGVEGSPITMSANVVDPGTADTFTYEWTVWNASGTVFSTTSPVLTFTPDDQDQYGVSVSVVDDDGGATFTQTSVTVTNAAPTIVASGLSLVDPVSGATLSNVLEGQTVRLVGTFVDPGVNDTHNVVVDFGDGAGPLSVVVPEDARTFTLDHKILDDNPSGTTSDALLANVRVADNSLAIGEAVLAGVTVANVAPDVLLFDDGTDDSTIRLTAVVRDVSPLDTFTYQYTFNGTAFPVQTSPAFVIGRGNTPTANIELTVIDDDGNSAMQVVTFYGGSDDGDTINVNTTLMQGVNQVLVATQGGDDIINVISNAGTRVVVNAGLGNDVIHGGQGNEVLDGGEGADMIDGGDGNDVLVGASGDDTLLGGAGDDVYELIPGSDKELDESDTPGGNDTVSFSRVSRTGARVDGVTFNLGMLNAPQIVDLEGNTVTLRGSFENAIGSIYDDVLIGDAGVNRLDGGEGKDEIHGGAGDLLFGGGGNDMIMAGNDGSAEADGGDGDDEIYFGDFGGFGLGGFGDDTIYGGGGEDSLQGGEGNDLIFGGFNTAGSRDTIDGGSGDDIIHGSDGDDTLIGGDGNDVIYLTSGGGLDNAFGGFGDDTIYGGGGDEDSIDGGGGNDLIFGGFGGTEKIDGGAGDDEIHANGNQTVFGGFGNDMIIGSITAGGTLDGGEGSDTLIGGGGDATLMGGSGSDEIYGGAVGFSNLLGGFGDDTIYGGGGDDSISGGEGNDLIFGGDGGGVDFFSGDAGDDKIYAGTSNDRLFGGTGNDLIVAAEIDFEGAPLANVSGASTGNEADGGDGDDTLIGGSGLDILLGGRGSDLLIGSNDLQADSMLGGFGNDTIYGGGGDDSINGGEGNDLIFGGGFGSLGFDATPAMATGGGGIDHIDGADGNDTIIGASGNDTLIGGGGHDILVGGPGSPGGAAGSDGLLDGGTGNDTLFGGGGDDSLDGGDGDDVIFSGYLQGGLLPGTLPTTGGGNNIIRGGIGRDRIFAGPGDDEIHGGDGNDLIAGGPIGLTGGNDRYFGDGGDDSIYGGSGDDTIDGGDGDDLIITGGGEETIFVGTGNDVVSGGEGNDSIFGGGGGGVDELSGDGGDDLIFGDELGFSSADGGAGDDTIDARGGITSAFGGDDDDLIVASRFMTGIDGGMGNDTIRFEGDFDVVLTNDSLQIAADPVLPIVGIEAANLTGGGGNNTLSATEFVGNVALSGGLGDDVLIGGSGDDRLFTVGGNDSLAGGNGNDQYVFDRNANGSVTVTESGGGGDRDRLDFRDLSRGIAIDLKILGPQTITTDGLTLTLAGGEIEDVMGTGFSDVIFANDRNNTIYGLGGSDYLDGGDGADRIFAAGTRIVWLDFDSQTDPGEHVYTEIERTAILARIADDFAPWDVLVTQVQPLATDEFAHVVFNAGVAGEAVGGLAEKVGFRELVDSFTVRVDVNIFLDNGGNDLPATTENYIALSSTIAAHELAHSFGVRHQDAFGNPGDGIYEGLSPERFRPTYFGFSNADQTPNHLIASPASIGTTLVHAAGNPYFGPRESLKLSFAESGNVIAELAPSSKTTVNVLGGPVISQAIGNLDGMRIPLITSPDGINNVFGETNVGVAVVLGEIEIDSATNRSESDYYSFAGTAGQVVTVEVLSQSLRHRISNTIDSVLRIYDPSGNPVTATASTGIVPVLNDDSFESGDAVLIDVVLPSTGTFTVEVDTFSFQNAEYASLPNDLNVDVAAFCGADPSNFNCVDTDTGRYELLIYSFGGPPPANVPGDTLVGGDGPDEFIGSSGDETILNFDPITDSVTDPSGDAVVELAPPRIRIRAVNDRVVDGPGTTITLVGSIVAAESDALLTTSVDWGDGNVTSLGVLSDGTVDPATATHTYATEGPYSITIVSTDDDARNSTATVPGSSQRVELVGGTLLITGGTKSDILRIRETATDLIVTGLGNSVRVIKADVDLIEVQLGEGRNYLVASSVKSIPIHVTGGSQRDLIRTGGGSDTILAGGGSDTLEGRGGADWIEGGDGQDRIIVIADEAVADTILGGEGRDTIYNRGRLPLVLSRFDATAQSIELMIGSGPLVGTEGDDHLDFSGLMSLRSPTIDLRGGNDLLVMPSSARSIIHGGEGNDTITAGNSHDTILGGSGDDVIDAGGGNDFVTGGGGNDTMTGGAGREQYQFLPGDGRDVIIDFDENSAEALRLVGFGAALDETTEILGVTSADGQDLEIDLDTATEVNRIRLLDTVLANLDADDFLF